MQEPRRTFHERFRTGISDTWHLQDLRARTLWKLLPGSPQHAGTVYRISAGSLQDLLPGNCLDDFSHSSRIFTRSSHKGLCGVLIGVGILRDLLTATSSQIIRQELWFIQESVIFTIFTQGPCKVEFRQSPQDLLTRTWTWKRSCTGFLEDFTRIFTNFSLSHPVQIS